jgi:hypothetical protein
MFIISDFENIPSFTFLNCNIELYKYIKYILFINLNNLKLKYKSNEMYLGYIVAICPTLSSTTNHSLKLGRKFI